VNQLIEKTKKKIAPFLILFENMAGQKYTIVYGMFEEIMLRLGKLKPKGSFSFLNTCNVFSSGIDLRKKRDVEKM